MKTIAFLTFLVFFISCQPKKSDKTQIPQTSDPCQNLKDTFNTVSVFSKADSVLPTRDFYEIVKFIESKGNLRLIIDRKKDVKIENFIDIRLPCWIDTCKNRSITQTFVLKNVSGTSCFFKSKTPFKGTKNFYSRINFTQWNFENNLDRDSAYKIMSRVYPGCGLEYEYSYNQTVIDNKRLYLIGPGAKMFEETGIEYANYRRQYIAKKNNGNK